MGGWVGRTSSSEGASFVEGLVLEFLVSGAVQGKPTQYGHEGLKTNDGLMGGWVGGCVGWVEEKEAV